MGVMVVLLAAGTVAPKQKFPGRKACAPTCVALGLVRSWSVGPGMAHVGGATLHWPVV